MRYTSGDQFIHEPDWLGVGESTEDHSHEFAHTTFVLRGKALIKIGDEAHRVSADETVCWRLVPAGVPHSVTLLEPGSRVICVFSRYEGMFT